MKRAVAAKVGLYGNSREEEMQSLYLKDGEGNPLDAAKAPYVLKLSPGDLPPVNAFWSITMYDGANQRPSRQSDWPLFDQFGNAADAQTGRGWWRHTLPSA